MRYFQLSDDVAIPGRWHLGIVTFDDGTEPGFIDGIRLRRNDSLHAPVSFPGKILDFCLTSFAVPIASSRLARKISAVAGPDLQSLPVEIAGAPGMMVLNAVRTVRCLDENRSEFIKWTVKDHRADLAGQYRQVTKLTVDLKRIPPDVHFFRIEGWPVALVVSEEVKSAMETAGCIGAKFADVTQM